VTAQRIEDLDKDLCAVAYEIETLLTSGRVRGLAAALVLDNGDVVLRMRYIEDGKIPLVAASAILHRDVMETCKPKDTER
jgi:hypothetical protein